MRILLALLVVVLSAAPAYAQRFAAIAFHDVVDDAGALGSDDIATGQLIAVFDWLKGNGWTSISLDDVEAARTGIRPLPPRPILLTFDDGYTSAYTRVYPLLLAYRFHAVFSLVGSWLDSPPDGTVRYGDAIVPRSKFLSWERAREMVASGLVEFASHGYDLHHGVLGNPQGSKLPSAATWAYDARTGRYETDAALQARVAADLRRSVELMRTHLGRAPRAVTWPFGRNSGPALAAARQLGFRFAFDLSPEPADASRPMAIGRVFPSLKPTLNSISTGLRYVAPDPEQRRIVCLSLNQIAGPTDTETLSALGHTIEDIRRLGARSVVLDAAAVQVPGEPMQSVWFPTRLLPMKADLLGFAAWQIRSRAGVDMYLSVDLRAAAASVGTNRVADLVRDMVRVAPVDGIVLDPPGAFLKGSEVRTEPYLWSVRAARDALRSANVSEDDRFALLAWQAAEAERPGLQLGIVAPAEPPGPWPAPAADWLLLAPAQDGVAAMAQRLAGRGWLAPDVRSRLALPLPTTQPDALVEGMRQAQALGAASFALCPAPKLPTDPNVNATFSAARFPRLP